MEHLRRLVIPADIEEIPGVIDAIEEEMEAVAFPVGTVRDLQLAAEEAIANTIVHGYRGASGEIEVAIRVGEEAAEVRIEDHARPFDPLSCPEPDRDSDLEGRRIGGLGVHLIRELADEVAYRHADGRNVLSLVKRRVV